MTTRCAGVLLLALTALCGSIHADETVALLEYEPWVVKANVVGPGIMNEVSDRLFPGEPMVRLQVPTRRLMVEAQSGAYDWLFQACHFPLPQHELIGRFLSFEQGVLVLAASQITTLADLHGKSVAVWTSRLGSMPQLEQNNLINKVEINDLGSGVRMVAEKRVAALAVSNLVVGWQLSRSGLEAKTFRYLSTGTVEGCLFAKRTVPAARREVVRRRLELLVTNGFIASLQQRYGSSVVPY